MTIYPKQPPEQVRSVVVLFSFLYRFQIGKKYWFQLAPGEHNLRLKHSWTDLEVYARKYGRDELRVGVDPLISHHNPTPVKSAT